MSDRTCNAEGKHGKFCDRPSLPGAPFPICILHAARLMSYLDSRMPSLLDDRMMVMVRSMEKVHPAPKRPGLPQPNQVFDPVVYYIRVGEHIKVGYTSNLTERLRAYPPDSIVLATEPGDRDLESERHRQFRDERRMGQEWFNPSERLLAHIEQIKAEQAAQSARVAG